MNRTGKIFLIEKMLIHILEQSQLSVGQIYFILKDIVYKYKDLYNQIGQQEANQIAEEEMKEKNSSISKD